MRLRPLAGAVTAVLTAGVILLPAAPPAHAAYAASTARVLPAGPIPEQARVRAQAHAVLKSVQPENEATLTEAPAEVVLTFNEQVDARFTKVRVTGPDQVAVSAGPPRVDGAIVAQPLGALNRQGVHTIAFRTVSADGHLISGHRTFTYAGATGVNGDRPGGSAPAAPAPSGATTGATTGDGTGSPAIAGSSRTSLLTAAAAGVGLVAALSTAVLLGLRRRRHDH